jgi:hypothetical protein
MMKWLRKLFGMKDELERQRMLFVSKRELPEDTFAIVRLTWFTKEGLYDVSEIKLIYEDESAEDMIPQFAMIVGEALRGGADVSILTEIEPELLGIVD